MTIRNVIVTSKNQVTLPSDFVKTLHLTQSRVLRTEPHDGKILLTPQPSVSEVMQHYWGKHSATQALTEKELKGAVREIGGERQKTT